MPERESAISKLFLSCGKEDRAILHGPHCAKQRTEATACDRIEVGGSAQEAESVTALAVQTFKGNIVPQRSSLTANPNLSTTTKIANPPTPAAISSGLKPVDALNASIPVLAAYRACDPNEESTSNARSNKVDQVGMIQMVSAICWFEIPQKRHLDHGRGYFDLATAESSATRLLAE